MYWGEAASALQMKNPKQIFWGIQVMWETFK